MPNVAVANAHVTQSQVGTKAVLPVILYDANGVQITSFGGGTEYTEGDTDSSITGGAILWEDTSDTLRAVSAAKPLPVALQTSDPAVSVLGATSGAKVITDANGTIQQYLRGLIYLLITSGQALVTATIAAGTAVIGKLVASTPVLIATLTNSAQTVVGSAGILTSYYVYNPNSSVAFVQIYDISGSVTVGTSVPKWSIGIPATSAANLAGLRLTFANAIKVAATTTAGGASAPSTALEANFGYE